MKKVLCAGVIFVLAATAVVFAVLYRSKAAEVSSGRLFVGGGRQWILAGDAHLFDITERTFNRSDLFGFAEGIDKWVPVGAQGSPYLPRFVRIDKTATMSDDEYVLGVVNGGVATAYPLKIMAVHQVVNDKSQDSPVLACFSNSSRTAAAFRPVDSGEKLDFGSTGYLYRNADLFYDLATESLFLPAAAMFVAGDRVGRRLEVLPSAVVPLGVWRRLYPDSRLMSENTEVAGVRYPRTDALYGPLSLHYRAARAGDRHAPDTPVVVAMERDSVLAIALDKGPGAAAAPAKLAGRDVLVNFSDDGRAAWITDSSGALVPSLRTIWQVYSTVTPAPAAG